MELDPLAAEDFTQARENRFLVKLSFFGVFFSAVWVGRTDARIEMVYGTKVRGQNHGKPDPGQSSHLVSRS